MLSAAFALGISACGGGGNDTGGGDDDPNTDVPVVWDIPEGSFTHSKRIMYVKDRGYCTGKNAFTDTSKYNMTGTDLGFPFYDDELKRLYVSFGDTNNTTPDGTEFNSNVTLYTDNLDFSNGIKWTGALQGQGGASRQVTPLAHRVATRPTNQKLWGNDVKMGDVTGVNVTSTIPTGTLCLNGVYYMWYMEVRGEFEATGEWSIYRNAVVKSVDKGKTWTRVKGLEWVCYNADETEGIAPNFGQIYPLDAGDGYVYIYGIPAGRSGGVQLGRVSYGNIDDFSKYQYFTGLKDGEPEWRVGEDGLKYIKGRNSSYIVPPMCGELSVCYNPYLQRYVMTYLMGNAQIVIRRSKDPWGSWSSPDTIIKQSDLVGLYGGMSNSALMTHDGKRMYLFVSEWYPAYNVHFVEVVFN